MTHDRLTPRWPGTPHRLPEGHPTTGPDIHRDHDTPATVEDMADAVAATWPRRALLAPDAYRVRLVTHADGCRRLTVTDAHPGAGITDQGADATARRVARALHLTALLEYRGTGWSGSVHAYALTAPETPAETSMSE